MLTRKGQVQGTGKEHQLRLRALRPVEPVHGSKGPTGFDRGVVYPKTGQRPLKTRNSAKRSINNTQNVPI